MLENAGSAVIRGDDNIGKTLVVAQQHVEARPQSLDQVCFKQQRFGFCMRTHEFHGNGFTNHAGDAVGMASRLGIRRHALFQAAGLADVKHIPVTVHHPVDTGRIGQVLDNAGNDRRPANRFGCWRFFPDNIGCRFGKLGKD